MKKKTTYVITCFDEFYWDESFKKWTPGVCGVNKNGFKYFRNYSKNFNTKRQSQKSTKQLILLGCDCNKIEVSVLVKIKDKRFIKEILNVKEKK